MSSDGISTTTTIASWVAIVGAGALYYVYKSQGSAAAPVRRPAVQHPEPPKEKAAKSKSKRRDAFQTSAQDAAAAAKATGADAKEAAENKWLSNAGDSSDNDADNKEFARQLANAREGTKFNAKSGGEKKRPKAVKQSQAAKASDFDDPPEEVSIPSSTAGADADDDQSLTLSPEVTAADAGGVSDMLEAAPAGPSILRIVDTDKVKQPQPKKARAPEPVETKKQRQNRKKREDEKVVREEAEKERKKLEENQRRTARIARGESAKDGSQFTAHVNGGKSAWGAPKNGVGAGTSKESGSNDFVSVQPLDTFEKQQQQQQQQKPASANVSFSHEKSQPLSDSWISDLPSEEEQLKKLQAETEWNTVKTKGPKRGPKKENSTGASDAAPEAASKPAAVPAVAAGRPAPVAVAPKGQNGKAVKPAPSFGSFSALSTNDADEKETEWEL
jgi:hypothetical protein